MNKKIKIALISGMITLFVVVVFFIIKKIKGDQKEDEVYGI